MKLTSLTVKIAAVVLIVSLLSVGLVAFFSGWTTVREYDRLVLDQLQTNLADQAATYYQANGSWEGALVSFGQSAGPGRRGLAPRRDPDTLTPLVLLDDKNCVIGPTDANYPAGRCLEDAEVRNGLPVLVDDKRVGTVIATGVLPPRNPADEAFLQRTGRGLLYGAIGASTLALLLGLGLAGTLTRQLRKLTAAIHATAEGQLGLRVDIRSRDEIGDVAKAFNRMSGELEQSIQQRKQMTADIAHELRNPLMVMTGYIEALRDGILRPTSERFDMMYDEAQHLQRLVADLRTLSLADSGELALTRQPTEPAVLLDRVAEAYVPVALKKGVRLTVNPTNAAGPGAGGPQTSVDVERMVQVLANLVTNAIRHTPTGGEVKLSSAASNGSVTLTVADTGEGIAPDVLPHIFDRFYRADPSRQQAGDESGLGLAIAKSIVTAHGGSIEAASTPGQGATFTIILPATATAA